MHCTAWSQGLTKALLMLQLLLMMMTLIRVRAHCTMQGCHVWVLAPPPHCRGASVDYLAPISNQDVLCAQVAVRHPLGMDDLEALQPTRQTRPLHIIAVWYSIVAVCRTHLHPPTITSTHDYYYSNYSGPFAWSG